MPSNKLFEKLVFNLSLLCLLISLMGTKACQDDYDLGTQITTAIPTATATPEPTETDDLISVTPQPTVVGTATNTATGTLPTATPTNDIDVEGDTTDILNELAKLDESKKTKKNIDTSAATVGGSAAGSENWLGNAYNGKNSDDDETDPNNRVYEDSDRDGFADWLEIEFLTDPLNPRVYPLKALNKSMLTRTSAVDSDNDGLPNEEEEKNGANPNINDTDADGFFDGMEVMAGTDPNDAKSFAADKDKDGVPDKIEKKKGTSSINSDSDKDGLSDQYELALGTNPLDPDSDKDGVSDGKEFEIGSDPIISDRN